VTRRWRIIALAVLLLFMAGGMLSIVEMSGDPAFIVVGAIPIVVLLVAIVSMWMRRGESEERWSTSRAGIPRFVGAPRSPSRPARGKVAAIR
jgi:hypothetical protein